MSSNRTILESLLFTTNNATNNDSHANHSNPVRARLANRLALRRTSPTNTSLPHTMTVASLNGTTYQLASERGEHLDATLDRNLLSQLGLAPVDNSLCDEAGESIYLNEECHPYFKYRVGSRKNDDTRSGFSTTLAIFACDDDAVITPEQQIALDDFCRYNNNINPLTKYWPIAAAVPLLVCLLLVCHIHYDRYKKSRPRVVDSDTLINPNLTQSLLGQEEKHDSEFLSPSKPIAHFRS